MSENLVLWIESISRDEEPLENCIASFIIGSKVYNSEIPTSKPVKIAIENYQDNEQLTIAIASEDDIIAESIVNLGNLRRKVIQELDLQAVQESNPEGNPFAPPHFNWDFVYEIEQDKKNPFESNLAQTEKPTDIKTENLQESTPVQQIVSPDGSAKYKADFYLSAIENKMNDTLTEQQKSEMQNLFHSLKTSFDELEVQKQKLVLEAETHKPSPRGFGGAKTTSIGEQTPLFKGSQSIIQHEEEAKGGAFKIHESDQKSFNDSLKESFDEAGIQFNTGFDYLNYIKGQLQIKSLNYINSEFVKELFLQMSRAKKKVVGLRIQGPIAWPEKNKEGVEVESKSFFRDNCSKPYLHYFQPFTKHLYLFNLNREFNKSHDKPRIVKLDINFDVSPHHKSIITPTGQIYLLSGKCEETPVGLDDSSNSLHIYHQDSETLQEKACMLNQRIRDFGVCYMSRNIFVMGGIVNSKVSHQCQRYDIRSNQWVEITSMPRKLKDVAICPFNNRYIYQFFGRTNKDLIDTCIYRYDAVRDKWSHLKLKNEPEIKPLYCPLVTQLNEEFLFVFGGKNAFGYSTQPKNGYFVKIEDKRNSNSAEWLPTADLGKNLAGTFSQNSIIPHNGELFFLRESK